MVAVADPQARPAGRNLTWWQFLLLVVVYAAIIQVGGRLIGADVDKDEGWETAGNIAESALIPIALSSLFVIGIATWLRWWPQIVHEPLSRAAVGPHRADHAPADRGGRVELGQPPRSEGRRGARAGRCSSAWSASPRS